MSIICIPTRSFDLRFNTILYKNEKEDGRWWREISKQNKHYIVWTNIILYLPAPVRVHYSRNPSGIRIHNRFYNRKPGAKI